VKLNLGCGPNYLKNWVNIDIRTDVKADKYLDLTKTLPFPDNSVQFIYNEHFIEHITYDQSVSFLKECYRVLKPTGVLRISTPNLEWVIEKYLEGKLDEWANVRWNPKSKCKMMNEVMRRWGHQFLYDTSELKDILYSVGFSNLTSSQWRKSLHPELNMMETRPYHKEIIIEASKNV